MKQRINISVTLMIVILMLIASVTAISQNSKDPTLPSPSGLTEKQVQQIVKDLIAKNVTKDITFLMPPIIESDGNLYLSTNDIEDRYLVACCWSLYLPIKMEVWGDNLNPISSIKTYSYLYYWDYKTYNDWQYYSGSNKNTDGNGIAKYGYIIPNKLSDRFWLFLIVVGNNKYHVTERWINVQWV